MRDATSTGLGTAASCAGASLRSMRGTGCSAPSGGPPTIPVTISVCEWNNLTATGTSFVGPGPYNDPYQSPDLSPGIAYPSPGPLTYEKRLLLHDTTGSTTCPSGPSGADLPGGFGWLKTAAGCEINVPATGWVADDSRVEADPLVLPRIQAFPMRHERC